jgi:hypothetical protein
MTLEVVIHWLGHALKVGTITAETQPARLKPALNAKAARHRRLELSNADRSLSVSRLVRLLQRREHRALSAELPAQAACRGTGWQLFAMLCGMVGILLSISAPRMRKARDGPGCLWTVAAGRCSSLAFLKAGGMDEWQLPQRLPD